MSSGDLMKSPYSGRAMSPVMSQKNQSQQNQMRRQIAFLMHEAKTAHTNAAKCMDLANAAKDAASPIRSLSSDQLGHPPVAEAIKSMLMCVQVCVHVCVYICVCVPTPRQARSVEKGACIAKIFHITPLYW